MKKIVISGINLYEGGPLSIFYDCLDAIIENNISDSYNITIFVHKKELFKKYADLFEIIELPKSRKSYLYRLYYEYCYFYKYSKKEKVDIWLSLHDITPRVEAEHIYTYCHNPTPFMKKDITKMKYSITNVAFSLFYKYLYRINIKAADAIIVQQDWMRKEFLRMYPINNIIVAKPNINFKIRTQCIENIQNRKVFIYAAFPRYFKNFEIICEASKIIKNENFEVWLTLNGTENAYARDLKKKYGNIDQIKWIGLQSRENILKCYAQSTCLIFPSLLETWGLPISEYKLFGKDMIVADLPYAHETVGSYDKVMFFNTDSVADLSQKMLQVIYNKQLYSPQVEKKVDPPFADTWEKLINMLIS